MAHFGFLLVLTIAALMVPQGETLKCWSCHSSALGEAGCNDPFLGSADVDNEFIEECGKDVPIYYQFLPNGTEHTSNLNPGLKFSCHKLSGKILGLNVVMRGCSTWLPNIPEGSCMDSEPQKALRGNIETCDLCAGDLCNGANVIMKPLTVFLLLMYSIVHTL